MKTDLAGAGGSVMSWWEMWLEMILAEANSVLLAAAAAALSSSRLIRPFLLLLPLQNLLRYRKG